MMMEKRTIGLNNNQGLTLVEVLVSLTILSIVLLSFISFFIQSATIEAHNQNKLVASNIARGVIEQLNLSPFPPNVENETYDYERCQSEGFGELFNCSTFIPTVNQVDYFIVIETFEYVEAIQNEEHSVNDLLPIKVSVYTEVDDNNETSGKLMTYLEGYLIHDR